jgi:pilus assembly protein CpaE
MARVRFPYLVTDLDNVYQSEQIEALWQADVILLILRMDYTSVRNTRRALDSLNGFGIKLERVRLVANACGERKQLTPVQAEEALGMKIAFSVPSEPAVILHAINNGVPAVLGQPSAKVSRSLRQLAQSCNGHYPSNNGHDRGRLV